MSRLSAGERNALLKQVYEHLTFVCGLVKETARDAGPEATRQLMETILPALELHSQQGRSQPRKYGYMRRAACGAPPAGVLARKIVHRRTKVVEWYATQQGLLTEYEQILQALQDKALTQLRSSANWLGKLRTHQNFQDIPAD